MDFTMDISSVALVAAAAALLGLIAREAMQSPGADAPASTHTPSEPRAPAVRDVSFQGLVQHYLATGVVVEGRPVDNLAYDRPLAVGAPEPLRLPLSALASKLPRFLVDARV